MTSLPPAQRAVVVEKIGGPEVLDLCPDYPIPAPKDGQILVKNNVSGVNYIDTYFRNGLYSAAKPEVLGREAAGTIVALGTDSDNYHNMKIGNRVVWLGTGGYAEYTAVQAAKAIRLPDSISDEDATASFLSGLTCLALSHETYPVQPGNWVLIHAAAGGVGLLMTQILKKLGAIVIGTAGGSEKAALVKSLGADYIIDYRSGECKDWAAAVDQITSGQGVDVVFDSVGKDTWEGSLRVVKRKGTIVWFGNASGPVPPLPLNLLSAKCVKIARPTLFGYIDTREEFECYSQKLFGLITAHKLRINIHGIYPMEEVQQAHKDLESRKTMGRLLLRTSRWN